MQAEQLDVVADVADDRQRLGAHRRGGPEREARAADATREQGYAHRSRSRGKTSAPNCSRKRA